jgi:hypothetical protein
MVKWKELSREEIEEKIKEAKNLKEEGNTYEKIVQIFKEKYSIEVNPLTLYKLMNPNYFKAFQYQKDLIKFNKDYILSKVKKGLEEGKNKEEIAQELSKELNIWPSRTRGIVYGIDEILKNPEESTSKITSSLWVINLIGINHIREKFGLKIFHSTHGDLKRIYEELKKGPLTTNEIKEIAREKQNQLLLSITLGEHMMLKSFQSIYHLLEEKRFIFFQSIKKGL